MTLHGLLLLGAAVLAIDHYVLGDGAGDGSVAGFACSLGDATPKVDRIERPRDRFGGRIPKADASASAEEYAYGGSSLVDPGGGWSECCECTCGGAATTLAAWPRDIVGYFDRKMSMTTSRKGAPRLKTHSRRCAFRDTGIEADCTCGLIPPRY